MQEAIQKIIGKTEMAKRLALTNGIQTILEENTGKRKNTGPT